MFLKTINLLENLLSQTTKQIVPIYIMHLSLNHGKIPNIEYAEIYLYFCIVRSMGR